MSLLQDHHIIPENFASNDVIRSLADLHLFDIQASRNRIYLPADRQLAFEIGTSRHAHHLDSYDDVVKDQLELARRNAGENSEALQAEVATLIDAMRIALAKGHLYTNAPAGMTSGQANDENRKFTDRRGRPAGSRRRHRPIATFAIWSPLVPAADGCGDRGAGGGREQCRAAAALGRHAGQCGPCCRSRRQPSLHRRRAGLIRLTSDLADRTGSSFF